MSTKNNNKENSETASTSSLIPSAEDVEKSKVYSQPPQETPQEQEFDQSDSDLSVLNLIGFDSSDSNSSDSDLSDSDSNCDELDDVALQEKIKLYQNRVKKLKTKVKRQEAANCGGFKFRSETARILATMQIRNLKRPEEIKTRKDQHKNKMMKMFAMMQMKQNMTRWTAMEKNLCLELYKCDPRGYKAYYDMGMVLAPLATVRRWLQPANRRGAST